ncbi:MAG: transcriptional regulator, partial [Ktedonobacteraceae bacterium]|nr:transcriptional regulator [Ktedonobacteraceae bacterium]
LAILRQHLAEADQKIAGLQQFRADLQAHIERFERWLEEREHH